MISPKVASLLARIPERAVRASSGTAFLPNASRCGEPERFAHVCKFLSWTTPLDALSKDDQRVLGLGGQGRAADTLDDAEAEIEEPIA